MTSVATVLLEVVTADGTAAWGDASQGPGFRTFQITPPEVFDDYQPGHIPVTIRHKGPTIGSIDYLEAGLGHGNGQLWAVGVVEGVPSELLDGTAFCSPELLADSLAELVDRYPMRDGLVTRSTTVVGEMRATTAQLHAVALVDRTAGVTSTRVRAWPGDYREGADRAQWERRRVPSIIDRAVAAAGWELRYNRPPRTRIHRPVAEHRVADGIGGSGKPEIHHSGPTGFVLAVRCKAVSGG